MNWDAIGSIGELVGAAGVIASLVYLSVQIRQNTSASRRAISHSLASAVRDWNRPFLNDADLAETFELGTEDPSQLSRTQRSRFLHVCFSFFRMYEDAHYQYRAGALDGELWSGYHRLFSSYAVSPGFQAYWQSRRETFNRDFVTMIDDLSGPTVRRLRDMSDNVGSQADASRVR